MMRSEDGHPSPEIILEALLSLLSHELDPSTVETYCRSRYIERLGRGSDEEKILAWRVRECEKRRARM